MSRSASDQALASARQTNQATIDAARADVQATLQTTRDGQIADLYSKAIEQIGSDKIDVRIGGIYALERIAGDSPKDHSTVMEVLAAFIREHSLEPWVIGEANVPATRPDVQSALTVIARRDVTQDRRPIDLHGAVLPQASLVDANLAGAIVNDASLDRAMLRGANLQGANFVRTHLEGAYLEGADLRGAVLEMAKVANANLSGADLTGAKLAYAQLPHANIKDAKFADADLRRTNFIEAYNFDSADFAGADFTEAPWREGSPPPEGWARDRGSRRLRPVDEAVETADNS